MEQNERERKIIESLAETGLISVTDIARRLGVSQVTVRGDLVNLEKKGILRRVRGGAVSCAHEDIVARQKRNVAEKQAIAKAAASLVENGDAIMLEAGTTAALLPRYLGGKHGVHIITNSALAFEAAKHNPALRVTVSGGEFRPATESFVGPVAVETIRRFNVRFAFIGTDGFSAKHGVTTDLAEGGEIIRVMKEKASKTVLLADATKYGRAGAVSFMPLADIDALVSNLEMTSIARYELEKAVGVSYIKEDIVAGMRLYSFIR